MLRNPFNDLWFVFQQFQVPLPWCSSEIGKEQPGILTKTLEGEFKKEVFELGKIVKQNLETVLVQYNERRRLDAGYTYRAWPVGPETLDRCDEIVFKEELECDFPAMAVQRGTQTPLFNIEDLSGNFAFSEQSDLRANVHLGEEPFVRGPALLQSWHAIEDLGDHLPGATINTEVHPSRKK